jgi:hypothetical protein
MTTKAPSTVKPAPAESLEKLAYASVAGLPADEPHDLDRLGYHLFIWLTHRHDPLEVVVRAANVRMHISEEEALRRIRQYLTAHGVTL